MAPPKKRNLNPVGLGRAIINQKVKDARHTRESDLYTTDINSSTRLQSVTQERDLDEFLNTAQLAGTEFTAERHNITIIQSPASSASPIHNPFLLSEQEEKATLQRQSENKNRLRVPRRPLWTRQMTQAQLERQERDAFLDWRRSLAQLQEEDSFLLTPFERNLEVWRQLWRVIERSQLVVQIVDARNPLRFRCEDLESYVGEVEGPEGENGSGARKRRSLLLINKADLLTRSQRRLWADYFKNQKINFAFFSAAKATALQNARRETNIPDEGGSDGELDDNSDSVDSQGDSSDGEEFERASEPPASPQSSHGTLASESRFADVGDDEDDDIHDPEIRILSVVELEELFINSAPDLKDFVDVSGEPLSALTVGLVGYPNVGKSSTINSLIGEKKVSVSSTPGKTKHFQTIHLSTNIVLCDCPGLVFPQFATTKADLVCDGVLPIDQLREYTAPVALITKRLPKDVLEATYGLRIAYKSKEEGGDGSITSENFLISYAVARGFTRAGQGNPDEARAARYILKDYVNAKLLFCHPPPGIDETNFNEEIYKLAIKTAVGKKLAPVTRVTKNADTFIRVIDSVPGNPAAPQSHKSQNLDKSFFEESAGLSAQAFVQGTARHGQAFTRSKLYPHQNSVANDGTPISGRRARIASVLANVNSDPADAKGKKHFKGNKRVKQRSGKGYD